jgi:hypothetical protein
MPQCPGRDGRDRRPRRADKHMANNCLGSSGQAAMIEASPP